MTLSVGALLAYALTVGLLWLTPGPVWVALTARALAGGFASAWPLAVGVTLGDLLWPLVAIYGLAWIVDQVDVFMWVLRIVAAIVFGVMGAALIRHAGRPVGADSRLTRPGRWAGFAAGVGAILGNPKAVLFYMGVLPGFFDLRSVSLADAAAIAGVSALVPLMGNLALSHMVGRARDLLRSPRALWWMNAGAGGLLIGVGLVIALSAI
ncbi:threonine/homoserine/homoserine lactone efflux protein [Albidovulum inexpectatum]|uniref:Threonine/homoserine/homoserine lactone efflux protein n=1 Tax=Albidovulum inexpectatum TaxID=196587 RepID=A0A2S5JMC6_9RHOB|nr:LysE family translocator [Albidovulum inexpectatum]PPB82551.1 threonine/homoserine/homoserine lactone efflux protein [Albidovulum inexpectatum]